VTLTGLATTDIEIYKDGSTTQRASDSGYALLDTDGIDFDGVTGIHGFSIDLADNTTAGFYAAGAQYWVVVASVTVDAGTVNFIAATFRIGYPDAIINTTIAAVNSQTNFTLTAGPAENNALNGYQVLIHDVASAVQIGRGIVTAYVGSTKAITMAAAPTFTIAAADNISLFMPTLVPTTLGRRINITATGNSGINWASVEAPTTTVGLSGTTVGTTTTNTDMLTAAAVNAEVVDVISTDTHAESSSVPAATSSLKDAIVWLKTLARNKVTQTSTTQTLRNDGDSGDVATSTVSDSGGTTTRGKWS